MAKSMPPSGARFPSGRRNIVPKFRPTMPPVSPTALSCASVRLRAVSATAQALEWVATSGAPSSAMSQKPFIGDVAAIDDHAARRAFAHQRAARLRQARAGVAVRAVRNGTPWAKALGRDQTGPSDRSPAS
jgi:hypothetical protein